MLGVLQSRVHLVWTQATCSHLGKVPRYTHRSCFGTFPLPDATEDAKEHIRDATRELVAYREEQKRIARADSTPDAVRGVGLSALYGEMPTELRKRHAALDAAVFAAYGWDEDPATMPEDVVLARLLELNFAREGV